MKMQSTALRAGRIREEAYFAEQDRILLEQLREVLQLQAEAAAACKRGCDDCPTQCEEHGEDECSCAPATNKNRVADYHAIC